jgi:DNA-binding NarL/FixJ family response regulator
MYHFLEHKEVSFMISGLERYLNRVEDDTIAVLKLLVAGKTVEQISNELKIPLKKVAEIKEKFESN